MKNINISILHISDLHINERDRAWCERIDHIWHERIDHIREKSRDPLEITRCNFFKKKLIYSIKNKLARLIKQTKNSVKEIINHQYPILDTAHHMAYMDRHDEEVLHAFTRSTLFDDVDLLVSTGDISTTGSLTELEAGRSFLAYGSANKNRLEISGLSLKTEAFSPLRFAKYTNFLIPGNHDFQGTGGLPNYWSFFKRKQYRLPKNKLYDQVFSRNWKVNELRNWTLSTGESDRIRKLVIRKHSASLCVIGLDFSLPSFRKWLFFIFIPTLLTCWRRKTPLTTIRRTFFSLWGGGIVLPSDIDSLNKATLSAHAEGQSVLWVMHYTPIESAALEEKLFGTDKLLSLAKKHGIRLILCGHTHEPGLLSTSNSISVINSGSLSSVKARIKSVAKIKLSLNVINGVTKINSVDMHEYHYNTNAKKNIAQYVKNISTSSFYLAHSKRQEWKN